MEETNFDASNRYPIELSAPDISIYKNSNTAIDYVWSFEAKKPGPHVALTAVVHGNEICGALALDWLLKQNIPLQCGKLSLGFMNVAAYQAFDPKSPNLSRWVDEDFNRLWDESTLDDSHRTVTTELARAREVRPLIDSVDLLLDIHSMQHKAPPVMMSGATEKAKVLAGEVAIPRYVIADSGHAQGRRMRDYKEFSVPSSRKNALLIECGQHWEANAELLAKEACVRFLRNSGVVDANFAEDFLATRPTPEAQNFFEVFDVVTIESDNFQFAEPWMGFEHLEKGRLIGVDGDKKIYATNEPTILVMPSKRLWPGQTAVRLAKPVE